MRAADPAQTIPGRPAARGEPDVAPSFVVELALGPVDAGADAAVIGQIHDAVARHGCVVLRDQRYNDAALLALGRRFGRIEERVIKYSTLGPTDARNASLWHHHSHCSGSLEDWILYYTPAVPDDGGELELFDAAQWFARLDAADRAWARQQQVRHDYTSVAHAGIPPRADPEWHPMVMQRGAREALYLGAHAIEVEGAGRVDAAAAGTPMRRMQALAAAPALYRLHDARAHDLLIWDMKMLAHRSLPWHSPSLRVIHEVIVREVAA